MVKDIITPDVFTRYSFVRIGDLSPVIKYSYWPNSIRIMTILDAIWFNPFEIILLETVVH